MFRYFEIFVSCEGLGEVVIYRSATASRAHLFLRDTLGRMIFGAKPRRREVISSQRKNIGVLQTAT